MISVAHKLSACTITSVLGLLVAWPTAALDPTRPLAEFGLDTWNRDKGLPHHLINDVKQSTDGYIWVATWAGAVRFNGREFVVFDQRARPWVRDGSAVDILTGADGSLMFISQYYGVSVLRNGQWRQHPDVPATIRTLFAGVIDHEGRLWLGSDQGVFRIDGQQVTRFGIEQGIPEQTVLWIEAAPDGSVWAGTSNGMARIQGEQVTAYGQADGLPRGELGVIITDTDGSIRVGGKDGAYLLRDGRFLRDPEQLPRDAVNAMLRDSAGALWIGTSDNGLYRSTSLGLDHLHAETGLPNDHVNALVEDEQGNLWIGTHGGLAQLRATRFAQYSRTDGLADDFVRSVLEDKSGRIWVGSNGGVSRIEQGRVLSFADELAQQSALSLLARRNGEFWIGTYSHGVLRFIGDRVLPLDDASDQIGAEVRAMIETRQGDLWIGTGSGLTRLREGLPARTWTRNGAAKRTLYVRSLLEDSQGRVWIGMQPGLARANGDELESFDELAEHGIGVFGLHECVHGAIWIVGQGGVRRWKDGKLSELDARFGLKDTTVFAIATDAQGRDWLSTVAGLVEIPHEQLEAAIDDAGQNLQIRRHGEPLSREPLVLNGGSMPSMTIAKDGRMWLATSQGVTAFDPSVAPPRLDMPPTVIEAVEVDGEDWTADATAPLPPGVRRIEFHYAGLSHAAPTAVRYRYQLEGYDADWIDAGVATTAGYTNLPPGDYSFRVESLIDGALGKPKLAERNLRLLPYLHQTRAFRWAMIGLAALLLFAAYRLRTAALYRRARKLQELVDARTRDLHERSVSLERADQEKAALIVRLREQSLVLERHAQEDGLTRLANRRHLDFRFAEALRDCFQLQQPIAVALIDIDFFKAVNDQHGHIVGDEVLRRVAAMISTEARSDYIVGRYGGEEFSVIFPNIDAAPARAWCEHLRTQVAALGFDDLAPGLHVTISIGLAARTEATGIGAMYDAADHNLYAAKRGGRNRVVG